MNEREQSIIRLQEHLSMLKMKALDQRLPRYERYEAFFELRACRQTLQMLVENIKLIEES